MHNVPAPVIPHPELVELTGSQTAPELNPHLGSTPAVGFELSYINDRGKSTRLTETVN